MEQFANLAQSTLASTILAGDTVVTVADAGTFPSTGTFRIIIDTEIIRVDSVAGADFTVTRGVEGTTAVGHINGVTVTGILTAGGLAQLKLDLGAPGLVADELVTTDGEGAFQVVGGIRATSVGGKMYFGGLSIANSARLNFGAGMPMLAARDNTDANDLFVLSTEETSDDLYIGSDANLTAANQVPNAFLFCKSGGALSFGTGATARVTIGADFVRSTTPIIGGSSVYGAHGECNPFDMADADFTAGSTEYSFETLVNGSTTPMTAARLLLLPVATSDNRGYAKFIRNMNGGGFDVIVRAGAAGTTVRIPDGFSAWIGVNTAGVFRKGPNMANASIASSVVVYLPGAADAEGIIGSAASLKTFIELRSPAQHIDVYLFDSVTCAIDVVIDCNYNVAFRALRPGFVLGDLSLPDGGQLINPERFEDVNITWVGATVSPLVSAGTVWFKNATVNDPGANAVPFLDIGAAGQSNFNAIDSTFSYGGGGVPPISVNATGAFGFFAFGSFGTTLADDYVSGAVGANLNLIYNHAFSGGSTAGIQPFPAFPSFSGTINLQGPADAIVRGDVITTSSSIKPGESVRIDMTGGSITLTIEPAFTHGDRVTIKAIATAAATCTVAASSVTVEGGASDTFSTSLAKAARTYEYDGGNWNLISAFG